MVVDGWFRKGGEMSEVLVSERNPAGDIWLNLYPKNRSQSKANIQKCLTYDKALSAIKNLHFALWKCEGSVVLSEKKFRRLYEDFSDNVENNLVALRFFYRGIFPGFLFPGILERLVHPCVNPCQREPFQR